MATSTTQRLLEIARGRDIGAQDERVAIIALISDLIESERLQWTTDQRAALTFALVKIRARGRDQ